MADNIIIEGGFFSDKQIIAEDFATAFSGLVSNGVLETIDNNALKVTSGTGMNLNVSRGYFWVDGQFGKNGTSTVVTIDIGDSEYSRYDRIVARVNKTIKTAEIGVLKGTANANPVAPDITRDGTIFELSLATIDVPATATELTSANIQDNRADTDLCGFCTPKFDEIDTSAVFDGFYAEWEQFKGQLAEDPAGNLQFQIGSLNNLETENKENLVNAINEIDLSIGDLASLKTEDKENLVSTINEVIDTPRKVIEERTTLFSGTATWDETRESYQYNSFKLAQTNLEEYDFIEIVFPPATPIKYYDSNNSRYTDGTIYLTTNTIKFKVTIPMPTSSSTRWIYDVKTYSMSFGTMGYGSSASNVVYFEKKPFYVQSRKEKNSVIYHNDELTIYHDCENMTNNGYPGVYVYPMKADIYGVKVKAVNE